MTTPVVNSIPVFRNTSSSTCRRRADWTSKGCCCLTRHTKVGREISRSIAISSRQSQNCSSKAIETCRPAIVNIRFSICLRPLDARQRLAALILSQNLATASHGHATSGAQKTRADGANLDWSHTRERSKMPQFLAPASVLVGTVHDRAGCQPRGRYAENGR